LLIQGVLWGTTAQAAVKPVALQKVLARQKTGGLDASGQYAPLGHTVQLELPKTEAYVPLEQVKHAVNPVAGAYDPAAQNSLVPVEPAYS
jgi:hypothetical protein